MRLDSGEEAVLGADGGVEITLEALAVPFQIIGDGADGAAGCELLGQPDFDLLRAQAYEHAVRERFRFYSYGDCMLVLDDPSEGETG